MKAIIGWLFNRNNQKITKEFFRWFGISGETILNHDVC